ncbi:hypothetical protein B0T09DRAFT_345604 [Sordaria sp. MPI-SDFR-AT-0083]|nr:hypothetical protein B0T09DRAFT_345604 [Sordaria sp. MPI-SDFR-AT-0083]
MAVIFERLSKAAATAASSSSPSSGNSNSSSGGDSMMTCLLSRELQLFADSEQRKTMLHRIGKTTLLSHCYTKDELVRFVVATLEDRGVLGQRHEDGGLPLNAVGEDLLSENVAWVSDRSCKNMGLPWGFTIMALN